MNLSLRRIARLSRWNAVLLSRNRLTLFYAAVLPLAPLLLLLGGERGSETAGANALGTVVLTLVLFPVYYNLLSQFVNRRDELVLKRMRTGETRDGELVVSIALPGFVIALVVGAVTVPVAAALGQQLPVNPVVYAGTVVATAGMFTALRGGRPSRTARIWSATSSATFTCASSVDAPRCGVAITRGWVISG